MSSQKFGIQFRFRYLVDSDEGILFPNHRFVFGMFFRYSISGLPTAYEAGERSPNAFTRVLGSIFNPADMLYNFFGNKPTELKRLKSMKKDDTVRNLLESKFDREMIAVLLGVDKKEIAEILQRCNYSEAFVQSANDLQILDAISECYEQYKVLSKNRSK